MNYMLKLTACIHPSHIFSYILRINALYMSSLIPFISLQYYDSDMDGDFNIYHDLLQTMCFEVNKHICER